MRRSRRGFLLASLLVAVLLASGGAALIGFGGGEPDDGPTVTISGAEAKATTALGAMAGLRSGSVLSFRGVRFGLSTEGERRWRPPEPSGKWTDTLTATQFAAQCPSGNSVEKGASEDCLFLNVYAPENVASGSRDLPVMFWIHGGANASGSASDYDPSLLVQQEGVVVVTTNYRVGVLGFLAHPAIDGEGHPAANYGLLDQQVALRWVRDNIRAFGGDPGNVTVFGASSGGLNILNHMMSPGSAGLFQKAVVQSGAYQPDTPALSASQERGIAFADRIGCADQSTGCLRGKSLADVLANQGKTNTASSAFNQSSVDGDVIPQTQRSAFRQGKFHRVPVMQGVTRFEGRAIPSQSPDMSARDFDDVAANYATTASRALSKVLAEYPLDRYPDPFQAASAVVTDAAFACPALNSNRVMSVHTPVFAYEFDEGSADPAASGHYADVEYLFQVAWTAKAESEMGRTMRHHWAQFARTGSPGDSTWRPFTSQDGYVHAIGSGAGKDFNGEHHCGFWGAQSAIPANSRI
ncbi:para-nitrobenzyl esterase [Kibdelosporangium banguiense]|uniref:Carboxylic ester hydrolase n=1 Tax=Kibdelosporangium banguiense TaxID=1365924 RepID=A0ABS4TY03_9PSEU|nr:carboxylesterase family protein [Kibdelosporangium banguiense]MBP2329280.1 para-nitrobenzyl esterase [Kibdelosporangium banguiense]